MKGCGDNSCMPQPSMEIVAPRASVARMREILHVTWHRVYLQNATLMAPLGSLRLRLVVVHGKTEASGNRGNGGKMVATAAEVARQRVANGAAADNDGRRRQSTVTADEVSRGPGNLSLLF